ncbi:hypothetical protein CASFOL_041405 [Castilleja foliolosa]|uniref:TF-B3 domain-containing protein n=1 Tax=Castilleja foliolosa TaxID=1961234 RepID=A0ABD3BB96_9LAMI
MAATVRASNDVAWLSIAGPEVTLPDQDSLVYYYPKGHFEQFNANAPATTPRRILCVVRSVGAFSVDVVTGRPVVKICLQPVGEGQRDEVAALNFLAPPEEEALPEDQELDNAPPHLQGQDLNNVPPQLDNPPHLQGQDLNNAQPHLQGQDLNNAPPHLQGQDLNNAPPHLQGLDEPPDVIPYYYKWLSKTDAKRSFRLTFQAHNNLLPKLAADGDSQLIRFIELSGAVWDFTHKRVDKNNQFLIEGWRKFVKTKRLVVGDTFIIRKVGGHFFIGFRKKSPVTPEGAVQQAVLEFNKAANGRDFEVMYFPATGVSNFVVDAGKVAAGSLEIRVGDKVQRRLQEDCGRDFMPWGIVMSIQDPADNWRSAEMDVV